MGASWADWKSKTLSFWSDFSYSMQQQRTISWLDCDVQRKVHFIQQLMMTLSMTGLKRSSKALPKAKFAPKKGHGHCLVVCCPSDPLKLSESQWNHYIWEVCSANQWVTLKTIMPAASIGQHKGPNASASQHSPHIAQPAQWLDQEEAPEHFPKPNLHQKKVMVIVRWSAAGLIHYSFLNPSETIISEKYAQQIDEMYGELHHLQQALLNRKGPVLHNYARLHIVPPKVVQALQIERIGLQSFASSAIFHPTSCQLTTTSSSILTTVCRENAFITSRKQKMLSRSLLNPEAWIFML